jgi:hypothetical protein
MFYNFGKRRKRSVEKESKCQREQSPSKKSSAKKRKVEKTEEKNEEKNEEKKNTSLARYVHATMTILIDRCCFTI